MLVTLVPDPLCWSVGDPHTHGCEPRLELSFGAGAPADVLPFGGDQHVFSCDRWNVRNDPSFPIERQIAIEAGPVVLLNVVTLDKADEQAFLKTWQDDAAFMKRQPGFISTQLHRALGETPT
jgi:hypothetical protein